MKWQHQYNQHTNTCIINYNTNNLTWEKPALKKSGSETTGMHYRSVNSHAGLNDAFI